MNELCYDTYICNSLSEFEAVPTDGRVLVILEEFDSMSGSRDEDEDEDDVATAMVKMSNSSNVSGFLKALDGVLPVDGRIIIATTNFIDKIDSAILRKGRFDMKVELKPFDEVGIIAFINRFYECELDASLYELKSNDKPTTGVELQATFLSGIDREDFINTYLKLK
jgi:chaperone BCS1